MFLGLGMRDRDVTCKTCWSQLQFGFKYLFLFYLLLSPFAYLFSSFFSNFIMIMYNVIYQYEIWRIFTSLLFIQFKLTYIIWNILFNFYILYVHMPDLQKKYSTIYIILEVFLQNLVSNVFLLMTTFLLFQIGFIDPLDVHYWGYSLTAVTFSFVFKKSAITPEQHTRFCFLPCLIPMKYVGWCYLVLTILFQAPPVPVILYSLLGFYQAMIYKSSFIKLPMSLYKKLDLCIPDSIKNMSGYIKVISVQEQLRKVSLNKCCKNNKDNDNFSNVQVMSGGISIDGEIKQKVDSQSYKRAWSKKEVQDQILAEEENVNNQKQVIKQVINDENQSNY